MYTNKIYINGKFLTQQESGVQAYARGIINALILHKIDFEILTPKSVQLSDKFKTRQIGIFSSITLWEQISLPRFMNRQKDAVLINFCNSAPLFSKNQIVTIHDLAFELRGVKWFSRSFELWYRYLIPRICKTSKIIFTVSQFSKQQIISTYKINPDKVFVIPNGIEIPLKVSDRIISEDYLLMIGGNNPRKNVWCVITQIDDIVSRGLKLVILGHDDFLFRKKGRFNHPGIIYIDYVSKDDYYSLIKHSKALVYPSLYEGFGVPILECLCMKIPVICNDLIVFRESFNDLPIYFDANDMLKFKSALGEISSFSISDEEVNKLMSNFSFSNSVSLILKTLEREIG